MGVVRVLILGLWDQEIATVSAGRAVDGLEAPKEIRVSQGLC